MPRLARLVPALLTVLVSGLLAPVAVATTAPPAPAPGCLVAGQPATLCETREVRYTGEGAQLAEKARALGTFARIYEYLRNESTYSPYHGARSNSVNAFLGLRGNDVDLASALIAMYRSQGVPARYAKGTARVPRAVLADLIGVLNEDLAIAILRDQGVQGVTATATHVSFEQVWVEVLLRYDYARGGSLTGSDRCTEAGNDCGWIPLSPAFKLRRHGSPHRRLLADFPFDYDAYYQAETNPALTHKSPLEIYEQAAAAWLRVHHPGVTLEDVAAVGETVREETGLLPDTLPFEVVGPVARYDSVEGHDLAEAVDWTKFLRSRITWPACPGITFLVETRVPLALLSTGRLTLTTFQEPGGRVILGHRLDGVPIGGAIETGQLCGALPLQSGSRLRSTLEVDVAPGQAPVRVVYDDVLLGGYYLIASGGETSNASQVRRAVDQLLAANEAFAIVNDARGVPHVDANRNRAIDAGELRLIDHLPAQDALTGGLLYVAQSVYYTRLREESERLGRLAAVISPISAYLGLVSATQDVEYLGDVPFAIMPGGLLIDLKGIRLNGTWDIGAAEQYDSAAFLLIGHLASSLEHEVWQQITGYDAISTVRGFQFAHAQGKPLLRVSPAPGALDFTAAARAMGYPASPPAGFVAREFAMFGRRLLAWSFGGSGAVPELEVIDTALAGQALDAPRSLPLTIPRANDLVANWAAFDALEDDFLIERQSEGLLKQNVPFEVTGLPASEELLQASSQVAGFQVASFTRQSATSALLRIDELQQHPDGVQPVPILLKTANPGDSVTRHIDASADVGRHFDRIEAVWSRTPGFAASAVESGANTYLLTVTRTGQVGTGVHTVRVDVRLRVGVFKVISRPSLTLETVNDRIVDMTGTVTAGIDVSDNQTLTCDGRHYLAPPSQLLTHLAACFERTQGTAVLDFLDRNRGLDPATLAFAQPRPALDQHDFSFLKELRRHFFFALDGVRFEYLVPARLPQDTFYLFNTYLQNLFSADGRLVSSTYAITNLSHRLPAGGGYVTATAPLDPADPVRPTCSTMPCSRRRRWCRWRTTIRCARRRPPIRSRP
jgi:hypothetical protein